MLQIFVESLLCAREGFLLRYKGPAFKLLVHNFNKTCSLRGKPAFLEEEFNN